MQMFKCQCIHKLVVQVQKLSFHALHLHQVFLPVHNLDGAVLHHLTNVPCAEPAYTILSEELLLRLLRHVVIPSGNLLQYKIRPI